METQFVDAQIILNIRASTIRLLEEKSIRKTNYAD